MKTYMTKDEIISLLQNSHTAVERAVVAIYRGQTEDEKAIGQTTDNNGIGFNGVDAGIMTSFAEQLLGIGSYEYNGRVYQRTSGKHLSEKQLTIASKKIIKYAGQLLSIAQARVEPVATPAPAPQGNPKDIAPAPTPAEAAADFIAMAEKNGKTPAEIMDTLDKAVASFDSSWPNNIAWWVAVREAASQALAGWDGMPMTMDYAAKAVVAMTQDPKPEVEPEGLEDPDWAAMEQAHYNSKPVPARKFHLGNADELPYMSPTKSKFFLARKVEDIKLA